ncbi:2-oxoacid:ferredoxin oxidoreductase subunit beta [Tumebacillus lipolyticus]|uniref:2-oxoacid:ferredoxin oxidoreductase subunit beta n=1 Tax=Tumebacillus lipolyticus TaxID=1280370 RepID=A0ABW5A241_9BACL
MATLADFRYEKATWCPGCGDFTVLASLQQACVKMGLEPENVCCVSGIGCSGKISQHFGSYGFHSLHGRSLPTAQGIKMANQELTVIAAGGDGDGYGIGMGHFIHACRRNVDITYVVMDNHIYGLTTGQSSPTSKKGFKTKTTPAGVAEEPIKPIELALTAGASFVAQAFSGDLKQMTQILFEAMQHKGFSLVNIFSPCVTFNRVNTYEWFKEQIVNFDQLDYDRADKYEAMRRVHEAQGVCTGIIYREDRPAFHEVVLGATEHGTVKENLQLSQEQMSALLNQFRR